MHHQVQKKSKYILMTYLNDKVTLQGIQLLIILPQTKFGGTKFEGVYRNHPVCLYVHLSVQNKLNLGYKF